MYNIDLTEDAVCRFCQKEAQTPVRVLCHCASLVRTMFLLLGLENNRDNWEDKFGKRPGFNEIFKMITSSIVFTS